MKLRPWYFLLPGLFALFVILGAQVASAAPAPKTVLVLSPFQVDLSTNLIASQALRDEFALASDLSLDVFYEYLDLNRFPDPAYQQEIFDLLAVKYKNKPVDLILISSEAMLKLWLAQRAEILPDTPVVFFDVFSEHLAGLNLPANLSGVSGEEDCETTVRWVISALPGVNEIVLVGGAGKIEQGFADHIQKLQVDLAGLVKFTDLSGLTLAEIKQRAEILPKTAVILYHPMFEDAQGNKYRPLNVLTEVSAVSAVPVLGGYDQFIGTGIIGGYTYSIHQQAHDAARIGLRVLRGEAIGSIPIAQNQSSLFIFDHLALQRFNIPLAMLPPDSIIKNRQYSFWELYQSQIIAAGAGFAVLLLLVIFLLGLTQQLNRARLSLAQLNTSLEAQVQDRTTLLHQTNTQLLEEISERERTDQQLRENQRRLTTLLGNLPGMAYRCRNDQDWTMDFVSEGCLDLTGYAAEDVIENRAMPYGQIIHPDDQSQVWENVQSALQTQSAYDMTYRIITSSGREKWVMERGSGVFSESGELLALEGFISDITQQKYTEQFLLHANAESESRVQERTRELTFATEALHQNEINFEAMVNNASDGILIVSGTGEAVFANARFAEIVGYSLAELGQSTLKDLAHPDEYPILADRLGRRLAGEAVTNQYETVLRHKTGRKIPVEVTAAKTVWQGQPADLVIVRDITERKQADELLAIRLRLMEFSETHSLDEFLQKTLDEVGTLVHSPIGFYHFVEKDQVTLALQSWSTQTVQNYCNAAGQGMHYNLDKAGVWVDAVHARHPVIHNDYASLTHKKGLPEGHAALIRELVVPILREDKVVAVLGVGNKATLYTEQDVRLVADLADVAWEITSRKKIEQELQKYRDHLEQVVQTRTAELVTANERLAQEIQERKINLAKYTALFDAFPLGITIADIDGQIIESNRESEHILGISRQDQGQRTVGGNEWRIIRPDGSPMPADEFASIRAMKEQRRIENIEMGIVKADQQVTWINVTAAPIPAEGLGVAAVYSDITARKHIEELLIESEEKFRSLLDSQENNIMMLDYEGTHHYVNQVGLLSMLGSGTEQDVIGKRLHDLFPAHVADWQLEQIREVFIRGEGFAGDFEYCFGDQSNWWHLNLQPIRNAVGQVVQVMVNSIEITERKRAERVLRESELFVNGVLNSLPAQIAVLDENGVIITVNEAWKKFAAANDSRDPDCYVGANYLTVCENALRSGDLSVTSLLAGMRAVLAGSLNQFMDEYPCDAPGIQRWFTVTVLPQSLPRKGLIVVHQDISERKLAEQDLRESEARIATILRMSPVVVGVSTVAEGRYTDVNDAFERVLGYSPAETVGHTSHELNLWVAADTRANVLRELQANGRVENLEIQIRRKSGEVFPALIFMTPIVLRDVPCLLTMMMDITERKRSEEQLRETRDALQTIIHSSPQSILALDAEDRITMWNSAAEDMFGWSDKQVLGQANPTIPESKTKEYDALRKATLNGMSFSNLDTVRQRKDGRQLPVSLSVAPLRGQQGQVVGCLHMLADITERKKMQEELRQQATTDELTRVPNRRHFLELAQREIKRAIRLKRAPSVALIDIDHFKQINDTYGHAAGDMALIAFSKVCQKQIREIDVFARFGGDEFVLLMPETNPEQAYEVIERIRQTLTTQPIQLEDRAVTITISSGVAGLVGEETIDMLLKKADQALYHAKETGRNRVVAYQ